MTVKKKEVSISEKTIIITDYETDATPEEAFYDSLNDALEVLRERDED